MVGEHNEDKDDSFIQTRAQPDHKNLPPFPPDVLASRMYQYMQMSIDDPLMPALKGSVLRTEHSAEALLCSYDRESEINTEVMRRAADMLLVLVQNMPIEPTLLMPAGVSTVVSFPLDTGLSSYVNVMQCGNVHLCCNVDDLPSGPQFAAVSAFCTSGCCTLPQGIRENFQKEKPSTAKKHCQVNFLVNKITNNRTSFEGIYEYLTPGFLVAYLPETRICTSVTNISYSVWCLMNVIMKFKLWCMWCYILCVDCDYSSTYLLILLSSSAQLNTDLSSNTKISTTVPETYTAESSTVKQIRRLQFEAAILRCRVGVVQNEKNLKHDAKQQRNVRYMPVLFLKVCTVTHTCLYLHLFSLIVFADKAVRRTM